jgi:uncharacterized protein YegL
MKIFDINTKSALDKAKSRIDRKKNRYRVNAKEDVTLLQQLITSVNPTTDDILCFSFDNFHSINHAVIYSLEK